VYEFHAWLRLAEDPYEDELDRREELIEQLRKALPENPLHSTFGVLALNGSYQLSMNGFAQRRVRAEVDKFNELIDLVLRIFPAAYGLIYERDTDVEDPPGPNAFKVRVVRRGVITQVADPFFSPVNPIVED
jgi:Immunity protein 7